MEETQNGKRRRLEEAKERGEFVKLLFRYASGRVTLKSGYVKATYPDSFDFNEIKDGHVTYDYSFLEEIKTGGQKWGSA